MDDEEKRAAPRADARYVEWRRANPLKPKYGSREDVMRGKCFCTRGRLSRQDLFRDTVDGKIKSRAMSDAMQRTWEDRLFGPQQA
jgi:hypothetical protein